MKHSDREQLQAILTDTSLISEAKVLWTLLKYAMPNGCSIANMEKRLAGTDVNVALALECLHELDLVEQRPDNNVVWRAKTLNVLPKTTKAMASIDPDMPTMDLVVQGYILRFDRWREGIGIHPWMPTSKDGKHWTDIVAFMKTQNAELEEYLDHSAAVFAWTGQKGVTPGQLAGNYARERWLNRSAMPAVGAVGGAAAHAGASYRPSKAVKRELIMLGHAVEDMDQAMLRYIDQMAAAVADGVEIDVPDSYTKMVDDLVRRRRAAT